MRLALLKLTRFGHFTNFTLELPCTNNTDFHVILGTNEAGKSTIVEGWLNLLYGIHTRTKYDFLHKRDTLQISAHIEDGPNVYKLTRVKKSSNSLLGPDGFPLPEAILKKLLCGIDEQAYRHLYCLDDYTLEKGGEDILASKGDLGQLLFSAASGLSAFNDMIEQERIANRALHIQRGQGRRKTKLYKLNQQLRDLKMQIKKTNLSIPEYRQLREEVILAKADETKTKEIHRKLIVQERVLRLKLQALPIKIERDTLHMRLLGLGPQPRLAKDTTSELIRLTKQREVHLATVRTRRTDIQRWMAERDKLEIDSRASGLSRSLTKLTPLRSRALNAAEDLNHHCKELDLIDNEILHILAKSGLDITNSTGQSLCSPASDRLDRALERQARAGQHLADIKQEVESIKKKLSQIHKNMSSWDNTEIDPNALRTAINTLDAELISEALYRARKKHEEATLRVKHALEALTIGERVFETPGSVPLTPSGAERLASDINRLSDELVLLEKRIFEDRQKISLLSSDIAVFEANSAMPTDKETAAIREERDRLWSKHLKMLTAESANSYLKAREKDDQAGMLRLAQVAQLAELRIIKRNYLRLESEHSTRMQHYTNVAESYKTAQVQLIDTLNFIGLPSDLDATTLSKWIHAQIEAKVSSQKYNKIYSELQVIEKRAQLVVDQLARMLRTEPTDLIELLAIIQEKLTEATARKEFHAASLENLRETEQLLKDKEVVLREAEANLENSHTEFADAVRTFGFTISKNVYPVDVLPVLRAMQIKLDRRKTLQNRIDIITKSTSDFKIQITEISKSWPELADKPALEIAKILDSFAVHHRREKERYIDLTKDLNEAKVMLLQAEVNLKTIDSRLLEIAKAWESASQPKNFDDIIAAIGSAQTAENLRQNIETCEKRLVSILDAHTLDEAESLLLNKTEKDLTSSLKVITKELKKMTEARDAAIRRVSLAEKALSEASNDNDTARLDQDRCLLLEEIRNTAEVGLKTRLGLILAERAFERYRDKHRGTMLTATESAFIELTGNTYSGLSTQRYGNRETLIVQRLSDGRSLRADEDSMSKGTRFQLYFALRLAGYRKMAKAGMVLPFLCDDIFETFDENRTAVACRLMSSIGEVGQALYFTHHAHVAEIAKRECPGVQIYRL